MSPPSLPSPPSPPPPRQSEEVVAPRASPFPLTPRVTLLAAAAVLAVVAQAVCLLPVAWPRGSPVLELCGGAAGARTHAAVAFAHFNVWLLQRELPHRPVRAACLMLAHLGLGSLAGGCAPSRCFPFACPFSRLHSRSVYVLWALREARGDWVRFWLGGTGTPQPVQGRSGQSPPMSPPLSPRPRGRPRKHFD